MEGNHAAAQNLNAQRDWKDFENPYIYKIINYSLRHEGVWGSGCINPHFLTSALVGGEWSASHLGRFTLGETAPGTEWIGGWIAVLILIFSGAKNNWYFLGALCL
jgi:hypothetical protein